MFKFKWMLPIFLGLCVCVAVGQLSLTGAGGAASCNNATAIAPSGGLYSSASLAGSTAASGNGDTLALNNAKSPDNTTDAATFQEGTANQEHNIGVSGNPITHTFNAAAVDVFGGFQQVAGTRNISVVIYNSGFGGFVQIIVNPATGAIVQAAAVNGTGFTGVNSAVWPTSDGYWVVWLHGYSLTDSAINVQFQSASGTATTYTGDGNSRWNVWGAAVYSP